MAEARTVRRHRAGPDELVVDDDGYKWTRYEGRRDVLIARAGIPPAAFDEANRCSVNVWRIREGEREIEARRTSVHRFLVYVKHPPAEQERRWAEREARRKARLERENVQRTIAAWPTEADAWRVHLRRWAEILDCMEGHAAGRVHPGFRLDDDTLNELGVHLQAIRGLLEVGPIVADPQGRARREAAMLARIREADPGLARFLTAVGVPAAPPA